MPIRVLHEIPPLSERDFLYVADRHKTFFDYPIHSHETFELNFEEHATGARRVVGDSSEVIGDYDLVLITSPQLEHVWEQHECHSDDIHEVTVQFTLNFSYEGSLFHTNAFASLQRMFERARRGLVFPLEAIMQIYPRLCGLSQMSDRFYQAIEFMTILYELSRFDDARCLASSTFAQVDVRSDSRRVEKVKTYIGDHYGDDLRLAQLSDLAGMTPSAFSRYFKQRTSKTLNEYIVDVRLGHAARMLVDTTHSVAEVCYACGFNTLSNFNRLFKKRKGCRPTEFRNKYHKPKTL